MKLGSGWVDRKLLKRHVAFGLGILGYRICYEMNMVGKMFLKAEYNDPDKYPPK